MYFIFVVVSCDCKKAKHKLWPFASFLTNDSTGLLVRDQTCAIIGWNFVWTLCNCTTVQRKKTKWTGLKNTMAVIKIAPEIDIFFHHIKHFDPFFSKIMEMKKTYVQQRNFFVHNPEFDSSIRFFWWKLKTATNLNKQGLYWLTYSL